MALIDASRILSLCKRTICDPLTLVASAANWNSRLIQVW